MEAGQNDPFAQLTECGRDLPDVLARMIVSLGDDAALRLLDIAEDRDLLEDDRKIWARTHAVKLLVELGADASFERLIRVFVAACDSDVDDFEQWVACVDYFPRLGQRFLDRVFELVAKEPELSHSVAYFVARFREHDDRIERLLDDLADNDAQGIALLLTSCEDKSRLPLMLRTFEKVVRDPGLFLTIVDLAHGIEELGGIIPEASRPAVALAKMAWECESTLLYRPRCPCGSDVAECACAFGRQLRS